MIYRQSSIAMPQVLDESIGCVITSPPYPLIQKWDGELISQLWTHLGKKVTGLGDLFASTHYNIFYRVWQECMCVLIPGGMFCINIGDATRNVSGDFVCFPNFAVITQLCYSLGFTPLVPIIWKKISNRPNAFLGSGFLPVNAYVSQDCEYIAIFRKGTKRQFNIEEAIRRRESKFSKAERDVWFSQIWTLQGARHAKKTSGWPLELFYRLMRMFSIKGDTILDPFCDGGGEEELLCTDWGRNYVGYAYKSGND